MATYAYECEQCNQYFEIQLPMSTPIKNGKHLGVVCPYHKTSKGIRKMISAPAIRFKGAGFTRSSVQ